MEALSTIQAAVIAARDADPGPVDVAALIGLIDRFAAEEPRWDPEGRLNLRTQAARLLWPSCPRDDRAIDDLLAVAEAGRLARVAQDDRDSAFSGLSNSVAAAISQGMPEQVAARVAGVDRMTVRRWQGKRR